MCDLCANVWTGAPRNGCSFEDDLSLGAEGQCREKYMGKKMPAWLQISGNCLQFPPPDCELLSNNSSKNNTFNAWLGPFLKKAPLPFNNQFLAAYCFVFLRCGEITHSCFVGPFTCLAGEKKKEMEKMEAAPGWRSHCLLVSVHLASLFVFDYDALRLVVMRNVVQTLDGLSL